MAKTYEKDYMKLMQEAAAKGDYKTAAQYEQQRNEKISDLGLDYSTTSDYAGWLDTTDYGTIGKQQMANGASAAEVLNTYNNRYNKAANTVGLTQYANDEVQQEMMDYILTNMNTPTVGGFTMPSFNFDLNSKPTFESQYNTKIDEMLNQILTRDNFTFEDAPTYTDNYTGQIESMMGQIQNRDPFSYDAAADPMYQQYQTQYQREGNRAMNDTLASAASHAGGMNSYAMTAANQANNYYAAQLADKIPQLQQLAYEMYLQDFDQDVTELNLLRSLGETEYNRWRDSMSDWRTDRSEAYGKYLDSIDQQVRDLGLLQSMDDTQYNRYRDTMSDWRDDRNFAYGQYRDDLGDYKWQEEFDYTKDQDSIDNQFRQDQFDYGKEQDSISNDLAYGQLTGTIPSTGQNTLGKQEFDYGKERDEVADGRYESETAYGKAMELLNAGAMPDEAMLKEAGLTRDQASTILALVKKGYNLKLYGNADGRVAEIDPIRDYGISEETQKIIKGTGINPDMIDANKLPTAPDPKPPRTVDDAINDLGIGPVSDETVMQIVASGGIKENSDGSLSWVNGWNAKNWRGKLDDALTNAANNWYMGYF